MAESICTEREWRKNGGPRAGVPVCWGAACLSLPRKQTIHTNKQLHACMLVCAMAVALLLPLCYLPGGEKLVFPLAVMPASASAMEVRRVSGLSFSAPADVPMHTQTFTREQLYRGRLLLLDAAHPLPGEAPDPATVPIATYGKGVVPVRALTLRSGQETVKALTELFSQLRSHGVTGFVVWRATEPAAPVQVQHDAMKAMVRENSLEAAAGAVHTRYAQTGRESLQQAFSVELRMPLPGSALPDERPLEETPEGRTLLMLAWRHGFVRAGTEGNAAFCFRYVGKAHATAITYLDVSLEEYLAVLHEKRVLTIREHAAVYYIQCSPASGEYMAFSVPEGAACEASMDNTGYALVACTLPNEKTKSPAGS